MIKLCFMIIQFFSFFFITKKFFSLKKNFNPLVLLKISFFLIIFITLYVHLCYSFIQPFTDDLSSVIKYFLDLKEVVVCEEMFLFLYT